MQTIRILRRFVCTGLMVLTLAACGGQTGAGDSSPVPPADTETYPGTVPLSEADRVHQVAGRITWLRSTSMYGNPGIKLEAGGKVIYVDPADLAGPDKLPKADVILVTHPHVDHFSTATIAALSKAGTVVVSIKEIGHSLSGVDFTAAAPGETVNAGGLEILAVPAYNKDHPKELGYIGFIFSIDGVRIYCSGDTGLTPEMESMVRIDIAVLNVRKYYSLSGEDTVTFAQTVTPKIVIPIHWMPGDAAFGDPAEIDYIRKNLPETTEFMELALTP